MCYKLTSLYHIAHGHAAALCVSKLWRHMIQHTAQCIDQRGSKYLEQTFDEIAESMSCDNAKAAADLFDKILDSLNFSKIDNVEETDYKILRESVNPARLKNNPILLDENTIDKLYHEILA